MQQIAVVCAKGGRFIPGWANKLPGVNMASLSHRVLPCDPIALLQSVYSLVNRDIKRAQPKFNQTKKRNKYLVQVYPPEMSISRIGDKMRHNNASYRNIHNEL